MAVIIFCEDDPAIQKLIRVALRHSSHSIHIANDGLEGLALIEGLRPAVIFTDISMPRLDGVELAHKLRSRPDLAHIPLVFMTASAQRQKLKEWLAEGNTPYIIKPFTITDLRATVERYVSQASEDASPPKPDV